MAHPDPRRQGSEQGQRQHTGPNTEASDVGRQDKSQTHPGTRGPERTRDDRSLAPEGGEKPEVLPATGQPAEPTRPAQPTEPSRH